MNADGKDYQILLNPGTQTAEAAARAFCIRNANSFDITTEAQLPACTGPVSSHLQRELTARGLLTSTTAGQAARPPARRQADDAVTVSCMY